MHLETIKIKFHNQAQNATGSSKNATKTLMSEWDKLFSRQRYRPLDRLLDRNDYQFLASRSGCRRMFVNHFRVERTNIFRGYMRCLRKDFDRILSAIKMVMVHSQLDRPDLAWLLMRQRCVFAFAML